MSVIFGARRAPAAATPSFAQRHWQPVLGVCLALLTVRPVAAQPLPADTVACDISGYSIDKDRAGAIVRADPDLKARVLGRLAPAQKATKADLEDVPPGDELWRTQYRIIGYRNGWFLIQDALHPYDDPDRRGVLGRRSTGGVKTYTGRGWLAAGQVGGKYTYHHRGFPNGALYANPSDDAGSSPAKNALGFPIQGGNSPKKVLACEGNWVKVESHDGVTGWWKGLCGAPISDCDR